VTKNADGLASSSRGVIDADECILSHGKIGFDRIVQISVGKGMPRAALRLARVDMGDHSAFV
jgi:hypothetical protein